MPALTLSSDTEIDSLVAANEYITNLDNLVLNFPSPTSSIPSNLLKLASLVKPPSSQTLLVTIVIGQQDQLSLVVSPFLLHFMERPFSWLVVVPGLAAMIPVEDDPYGD
ncbi:hypothetical protein I350_06097 [Cryptococcus amylolentus CBS 6273]|uniref:Uncharacterized protein n=1 Tax=Cryptococcus amylolentus CBS 6273 TaxID=1296118 RepID=A0A1E3JQV1_9TREE|nr:hypothetical protein I350_06097 [Cryptococcus amylolentus CBS 6273]